MKTEFWNNSEPESNRPEDFSTAALSAGFCFSKNRGKEQLAGLASSTTLW